MKREELLKRAEEKVKHGEEFLKITPNVKEWNKELEFDKQIVAILSKEVTEERIEEMAITLCERVWSDYDMSVADAKVFIRSLVEEIRGK